MTLSVNHPFSFPVISWQPEDHEDLTSRLVDGAAKLRTDVKGAVLSHAWRNVGSREMFEPQSDEEYAKHGYSSYKSGVSLFDAPWLEIFEPLHKAAFQACYRYIRETPWDKPDADLENLGMLNHSWVSVYGDGHFIPEHVHTDSHISWVFYGASNEDSGHIIFRHPAAPVFRMSYQEDAEMFYETFKMPPTVGSFIVFPSFMQHFTEQHFGDEDRIIYSGNFVFRSSVTGHGTAYRMTRVAKDEP